MDKELKHSVEAAYLEYNEEPMSDYYQHALVGYPSRLRVRTIFKELGDIRGKKILDAGCEEGYVTMEIARRGGIPISFDIVEPAIMSLKKKSDDKGMNMSPFLAFAQSIPLKDNSVDAVICTEVVEHMPKREEAFAEFARVLKPGGKVVITFPNEGLRRYVYPIAKAFGINTDVEEHVTLFEYTAYDVGEMLRKHFKIRRPYQLPWFLPLTNVIIAKKI